MEPFLGKWKLDREFDENVEGYAEAEGVPLMMRKSFGKMEVNMIMEKVDNEGLGRVRKKKIFLEINLTFYKAFTIHDYFKLGIGYVVAMPIIG